MKPATIRKFTLAEGWLRTLGLVLFLTGCATLFGWDIHAPGLLSQSYYENVKPLPDRAALYLSSDLLKYQSTNRGSPFADPQKFHVGEAFGPMLLEAFQGGFQEFIFMEAEPSAPILKRYGIPYLAVVRIKEFKNHVTMKGQAVSLVTETAVFDSDFKLLARFESRGTSDARKIFSKKGGPEVNLNAALENNVLVIVQHLQDSIRTGAWKEPSLR